MITLSVVSFNGQPMSAALSCNFDELGGTIGRADSNQLVLPDPERTISRVAAQVLYRSGNFAIVDRGSNPILLNGQTLGSGHEAMLKTGDRVRIGGYELLVQGVAATSAASAAASDPFAGLLGPTNSAPAPGGALLDPLAAFAAAPASAGVRSPATPPPPAPPSPSAPSSGIPNDWDPFAPDPTMSRSRPSPLRSGAGAAKLGLDIGAAAPPPLMGDFEVRSAEPSSLDALFGLGPSSGGDPLANSVLNEAAAKPNMAADADPLRALSAAPKAVAQALPDQVSDLNRPFIPPTVIKPAVPARAAFDPAARSPTAPPAPPLGALPPAERADSGAAVMSWDTEGNTSHTVIRTPLSRTPEPAAVPSTEPAVRPLPTPTPRAPAADALAAFDLPPPAPSPAVAPLPPMPAPAAMPAAQPAAAPAPGAVAGSADVQALLDAFRRGLETPNLNLSALTPELMELLGSLLHEAAAGTVDLLTARATFKRELRAKGTTIVARNNNPLKFSPSAEVAIQHLLSPPARGFMPAAPAMRDAYDDLRAHQVGFVAGLQAALDGVLHRFDPAELEKRLTERSMLHSLLPATRKARMWEVFIEQYTRIRAEASDDFHTLFGTAFLKAYEEQIEVLQQEREK